MKEKTWMMFGLMIIIKHNKEREFLNQFSILMTGKKKKDWCLTHSDHLLRNDGLSID